MSNPKTKDELREHLKDVIRNIPRQPGIYKYKDENNIMEDFYDWVIRENESLADIIRNARKNIHLFAIHLGGYRNPNKIIPSPTLLLFLFNTKVESVGLTSPSLFLVPLEASMGSVLKGGGWLP